ncbi:hypothetical protein [Agaribacter marinus]|uniref:PH domain-containing protein n=1 Tax=Agaribacter marinus TaxID=1431249 RepID=A0AA37WFM9_9ALTE|nr:hypothetical protein [Agaribacter marinus]GLR69136.1 hypothetical protein GCM10007852_00440 [Agaribacter marinus]
MPIIQPHIEHRRARSPKVFDVGIKTDRKLAYLVLESSNRLFEELAKWESVLE